MIAKLNNLSLKFSVLIVMLFINTPVLIIAVYAFTTEEAAFTFPPPGLTTRWFGVALSRGDLWDAFFLSLQVAAIATSIALVLGTLAAFAIYRFKFFGRESLTFLLILPIALPGIVTGIALRSTIGTLDIPFTFWTIVVGHATFCVILVYNNVIARFRRMSWSLVEASMDLGADGFKTARYVLLPQLGTALLAGGMLAFALSFDEVIVTTFTAGQQSTLPIWIFSQLTRPRSQPITNVVALLVVAITLIPILLAYRLAEGGISPVGGAPKSNKRK